MCLLQKETFSGIPVPTVYVWDPRWQAGSPRAPSCCEVGALIKPPRSEGGSETSSNVCWGRLGVCCSKRSCRALKGVIQAKMFL